MLGLTPTAMAISPRRPLEKAAVSSPSTAQGIAVIGGRIILGARITLGEFGTTTSGLTADDRCD